MDTKDRVKKYINDWKLKGYAQDIPDEVPHELMQLGIAPSYKAIAMALLDNDLNLYSLGFTRPQSEWYGHYKRIELEQRKNANDNK